MKSWRNCLVSGCQTKEPIKAAVSHAVHFEGWVAGAPTTAFDLDPTELGGTTETSVVNIVTPPDGQGGFGDLVTNVYMAEKLRDQGYRVNFFLDPTFRQKFVILFEHHVPLPLEKYGFLAEFESIRYYSLPTNPMVTLPGDAHEHQIFEVAPPPHQSIRTM